MLKSILNRVFTFINRFQAVILSIFVLGLVDVVLYSDALYAFLLAPEFLPLGITIVIAVGFTIFIFKRFKKPKTIGEFDHAPEEREACNMTHSNPDVEAKITFLTREQGGRTSPVHSGYRPAHLVRDDYLTTGVHEYYDRESVELGETVLGTITFVSPEAYPNCLWVGKRISIQEGSHVVGDAEITQVFNEVLLKHAMD